MKVRILEQVKHNGEMLEVYDVYDLPDDVAQSLINSKAAETVDAAKPANPEPEVAAPKTPKFDPKKNGGYVGEAKVDPAKLEELEKNGETDDTPVVGTDNTLPKDTTPEPAAKTVVYDEQGNELTDEQVAAREAAASTTTQETNASTVGDLQNSGEEVK